MRKERAREWRARKRSLAGLKPGTMWFKICTVNPEATKAPVLFFMRPFLPGKCPPLLRQAFCYRFVLNPSLYTMLLQQVLQITQQNVAPIGRTMSFACSFRNKLQITVAKIKAFSDLTLVWLCLSKNRTL